MRRVLVGTDGSATGQAAVRWAAELAGSVGAEVVVAAAWHPSYKEVSPEKFEELRREARDELETFSCRDDVVQAVEHRCVLLEEAEEDVAGRLLEAADAENADLVVVGAPGAGTVDESARLLGGVTHALVRRAKRPLAAIPERAPKPTGVPCRILVVVEGSDGDSDAVRWSHDLAGQIGAEVFVVVEDDLAPAVAASAAHQDADLVVVGGNSVGRFLGRIDRSAIDAIDEIPLPTVVVPASADSRTSRTTEPTSPC
jgi:nucleotide-binding universal stress UspA family protein